jgi:hypothetical protein
MVETSARLPLNVSWLNGKPSLLTISAITRSARHRRRQDQGHATVPLSGPHPATQDEAGTTSEAIDLLAVGTVIARVAAAHYRMFYDLTSTYVEGVAEKNRYGELFGSEFDVLPARSKDTNAVRWPVRCLARTAVDCQQGRHPRPRHIGGLAIHDLFEETI